MNSIKILINESRGINRENYIISQGIPIKGFEPADVDRLSIVDDNGKSVAARVEIESIDPVGNVDWVSVALPVTLAAGQRKEFTLAISDVSPSRLSGLVVSRDDDGIHVANDRFDALFGPSGWLEIKTSKGIVVKGNMDFSLRSDVRSKYGRLIMVNYEPGEFEIISASSGRVHIVNRGQYTALEPKAVHISKSQRYDVDLEFILQADSPVIRYRWRITNHMKFNCKHMWLSQYAIRFPVGVTSIVTSGEGSPEGDKSGGWAQLRTTGGALGVAFPHWDWFGKGAGIAVENGTLMQGGINPPVDGGFGGRSPDIWRQFFYGMSRTFEGALVIDGTEDQVKSEAYPIPLVLSPEYYSECGTLPEKGGPVTFGIWKDVVDRAAENLLRTQWKGTLWCGEWWREWDTITNQGTQETHSGNAALGVLYHFYRTGDWRFWESAKMSYYYAFDIQFCKQEDGDGPYMHTRRFMLDSQGWFHPRYQRVGTLLKVGHLLADKVSRDKVLWYLRYWGDNYVAEDGAPMAPDDHGGKGKCDESAMSNFAESLCFAYKETGDEFFLEKAKLLGDWVIRGFDTDTTGEFIHNNNDTRYVQRGLMALCEVTKDSKYIDAFCRIARWTVTRSNSGDYVPNHLWFLSQAYEWSGDKEIANGLMRFVEYFLDHESKDEPGVFLQPQIGSIPPYPDCVWDDFYTKKAIVSYLPLVASVLGPGG
ncbi:MAG: hypothetical protein WCL39_08155 [Armatimonadota bacterium]